MASGPDVSSVATSSVLDCENPGMEMIHKSVKYIVKIACDLWDSVLSKMILTRFECCSEMWQLRTHLGCFPPYLWQLASSVAMTLLGLCLDQLFSEGVPDLPHNRNR